MRFTKRVLAALKAPYPLGILRLGGTPCVVCSTEDHGPIMLVRPPYTRAEEMLPGPGGSMALVEDPANPGELYSIMGCFPGYKFQDAAVYRVRREAGGWAASPIAALPFAHRIDFVTCAGTRYLVAASLAQDKADPSDWSKPGCLYACPVPSQPSERWTLTPVLEGIHRNHGLLATRFQGRRSLLVSGTEGLFCADLDSEWLFQTVMKKEISEIAVADLDGDGKEELVTIEPFHGDALCVYRQEGSSLKKAWEGPLAFGHGLLGGTIAGAPAILVSNRSGSRDLVAFQWTAGLDRPALTVVDAGVGAANMLILRHGNEDLVFSTNQASGEIAAYSAEP
ncbi:MAG TPA: hypothetical protein VMM82_14185 [Spirochaetia bacterium]|nr:hypothetical protein [Spirochaetia bacterium]